MCCGGSSSVHLHWFLLPHPEEQRQAWSQWLWISSFPPDLPLGFALRFLLILRYQARIHAAMHCMWLYSLSVSNRKTFFYSFYYSHVFSFSISLSLLFLLMIYSLLSAGFFVSLVSFPFALPLSLQHNSHPTPHTHARSHYLFIQSPMEILQ